MQFQKYFHSQIGHVRARTQKIISDWHLQSSSLTPTLNQINTLLLDSATGGKSVRGFLVKLGYDLFADKPSKSIYSLAAAYEIAHTALLVHDDIIDKSALRRGRPTIHAHLGNTHYGLSHALCLGDQGLFLASHTLSHLSLPEAIKKQLLGQFYETMLETTLGQMLDIETTNQWQKNAVDILSIYHLKTANYTVVGPLVTGALASCQAEPTHLKALKKFGTNLGIAFQIQDDVLGIFGEEEVIGKSNRSDIEEGKNTLLIAKALERATENQKHSLEEGYGRGPVSSEQFQQLKDIFMATDSLDYCLDEVANHLRLSRDTVPLISDKPHKQKLLYSFVDFIADRQK